MNFRIVTHYLIGGFLISTLLPSYADEFNNESNQPENLDPVETYLWFSPVTDNEGFVEGSHFKIFTRNWFENNEMRKGQGFSRTSNNGTVHKSGYARTWTQGTQFIYESGFTQGVLGIGVDVSPFVGVKLDGGGL